jgi:plasmid stabilization system protein ParE
MKRRTVVYTPEAQADLLQIYDAARAGAGPNSAYAYVRRLKAYCDGFDLAGERGSKRGEIRPGLRVAGFERRVAITFTVDETEVVILRILYGGRDLEGLMS